MTSPINLSNGKLSVTLCPDIGGSIARFQFGTLDVLRSATAHAIEHKQPLDMALYPMVPCSGRIVNGQLDFDGTRYTLTPNFPPEPHAIHGVGWRRAWRVEKESASSAVLSLDHTADMDWPFSFQAHQTVELSRDSLTLTYTLVNSGAGPMPAGLGFHPFFPRTEATTLQTEWRNIWITDAAMVPVELQPIPAAANFQASATSALGASTTVSPAGTAARSWGIRRTAWRFRPARASIAAFVSSPMTNAGLFASSRCRMWSMHSTAPPQENPALVRAQCSPANRGPNR